MKTNCAINARKARTNMADITKLNEQIAAWDKTWDKNLERLKNGEFGDLKNPKEHEKALMRYWQAQDEAGYPSASDNVRYFASQIKCKETKMQKVRGMKNPFKRIAAWLHKKKGANEISLESRIVYLGHEFQIKSIDLSFTNKHHKLTIHARERENER
jgi:uncharacterized lipoprotein NlpE involved in copper resistance